MTIPAVVVVDDHESFRRIARAVVTAAGCTVVAEADAGEQARSLLHDIARPDLVLMDVNLGTESGIELTRELVEADPDLRVVLVSTIDAIDLPADYIDAGAIGFVQKSTLDPQVIRALVEGGGTLASPAGGCQHPFEDAP